MYDVQIVFNFDEVQNMLLLFVLLVSHLKIIIKSKVISIYPKVKTTFYVLKLGLLSIFELIFLHETKYLILFFCMYPSFPILFVDNTMLSFWMALASILKINQPQIHRVVSGFSIVFYWYTGVCLCQCHMFWLLYLYRC